MFRRNNQLVAWLLVSCSVPVCVLASAGCAPSQFTHVNKGTEFPVTVAPAAPEPTPVTPARHLVLEQSEPRHTKSESIQETLPLPKSQTIASLTLDQAINLGLVNDPKLRAGFEAINQAQADALTVSLKPNPSLWTDVQLLPLTRPFTKQEQGGPPQQDVQVSYAIDWFLFGKRAAAMASASMGLRGSEADYANLVRQRVTQISSAYYDLLEAKGLLDVARHEVREIEAIALRSTNDVKNEKGTALQGRQVQLQLVKSRRTLRDAEAAVETARSKFRTFFGGVDRPLDVEGTLDTPLETPSPKVEEAIALARQHRPDLEALRWKLSQAHADIDVEQRKAYPTVTPTLGYTRQYQQKAIGFPDANSWMASLEMPLPFCNRNEGGRAKAASMAAQRQYELEAADIELRGEVEAALQDLAAARANAEAIVQEQLRLAREILDENSKAYQAAKDGSLTDVLDAQREYYETLRSHISSRATYWRAQVKLNAALGKQLLPHGETP